MNELLELETFEYENHYYESTKLVARIIEKKKENFSLFDSISIVLKEYNIVLSDEVEIQEIEKQLALVLNSERKIKDSIKYKWSFFNGINNENFVQCIAVIFKNAIFYPMIFMLALISIWFLYSNSLVEISGALDIGLIMVVLLSTLFIHELGHSLATHCFTGKVGTIGLGFFMGVMPVLYTDVSRIWTISALKRVVVNLSGIYFQLIVNFVLIFLYFIFKLDFLVNVIYSSSLICIYSIIPFFKSDGYWVYSDLFNIKNLAIESNRFAKSINILDKKTKTSLKIYALVELSLKSALIYMYASNWAYFYSFLNFETLKNARPLEIVVAIMYTVIIFKITLELINIIYANIRRIFR